jgi:polysaccharide biosynthesis protein PslF
MRVLHLSPYPPTRSGIAAYGDAFAAALETAADKIELQRYPDAAERPASLESLARQVLSFHEAVRNWQPHIIHIETAFGLLREFYALLSLPASRRYRVVATAHDAPCLAGEPLWFIGPADGASVDPPGVLGPRLVSDYSFAMEKRAYHQCDVVIALSIAGVNELRRQFGEHRRLEQLPHGVAVPGDSVRRSEGPLTPGGPLRLLYFGYLHPQKGLDRLIGALSLLPPGAVTLTVAGAPYRLTRQMDANSELVAALMKSTASSPLPQQVRWLGYVPDERVSEVFSQHDVLVLPYKGSGLRSTSGVMYRGMAHGLAVVATRVQALHESIEDGVSGLLVEPDSSQALAAAIAHLMASPGLMARLGAAARERVVERHGWPLVARRMTEIYEGILGSTCTAAAAA